MASVHPAPTEATVRALYGNAVTCGNPQCTEPLYRIDPETGARTLNSRVAHICARREKGPRWDQEMTSAENRSADNLILLCLLHAAQIDDPQQVDRFPAAVLRLWKAQQLDEHDRLHEGWSMSPLEAAEVVAESEEADRQRSILSSLHAEYLLSHDGLSAAMLAGTAPSPKTWVEARLRQLDEPWRRDTYYLSGFMPSPDERGTVVTEVHDVGDDRLEVFGTVDGEPVVGYGSASALTNHFDSGDYYPPGSEHAGHRRPGATPPKMTDEEKAAYFQRLLGVAADR